MIIRSIETVFSKLFIERKDDFEQLRDVYRPLIDAIFPDLFFCAGDGNAKLDALLAKSDVATNEIIKNILYTLHPSPRH